MILWTCNQRFFCGIQIENGVMQAFATVKSPTQVNYPTGYYGIKVRVYNDSGTIIINDDWFYNPESNISGRTIYSNTISASGTYVRSPDLTLVENAESYIAPMYLQDGKTVIGEYRSEIPQSETYTKETK